MILIDTNIFLELLLGRSRADECEALLNAISEGKVEAIVTHFTIHAIEAILRKSELIEIFLRNLERSIGLYIYDTDISDELAASIISKQIKRDFDDSLQYYVAKKLGAKAIISFDKHFNGLDIPCLEPKEALEKLKNLH